MQALANQQLPNITWEIVRANPVVESWTYPPRIISRIHNIIYHELITQACTPERLYQWNEGAAEEYPEEYAKECEKYKKSFQKSKNNSERCFHTVLYRKRMTAQMHAIIDWELMMRVCTPARLFQWNEGAAEEFPAEYLRECAKYK